MPRRIEKAGEPLRFTFDGVEIMAQAGDSVAAALLAGGYRAVTVSAVSGMARGPYCLMGACFECMVRIDGVANRQACMTEVEMGMEVRRMTSPASESAA